MVGCLKHQKLAWGSLLECDNAEFRDKLLSTGHGKSLTGALVINVGELKTRLSQPTLDGELSRG